MTQKRFSLSIDTEWWFVQDNTIQVNKYGYRDDLTGEDEYRGLHQELTEQETVDLLNELHEENQELKKKNKKLSIDFIDFKMKLIEQLQIHYDYASEQRQKNLDDPFVAQAYDIIRCDVRNLAEEMGVDLE